MPDQSNIRNFAIISHIDHGKSTLADRFLEITNTVPKEKMRPQYLDLMDLEQEKGITIKMQPVRMAYTLSATPYILNLIDTPGHVDFSYEVSRSLAAVEGVILLVDATKGIQAQTLANLELAKEQKIVIIPAINKVDSPQAQIEKTQEEICQQLKALPQDILQISAKTGKNVHKLLEKAIKEIPPPSGSYEDPLRALIFDSKYDPYKGVIACVRIVEGKIKSDEGIYLMAANYKSKVKEVGFFSPLFSSQAELKAGDIGYIATGIKKPEKVRVGDTIIKSSDLQLIKPLLGYKEPRAVVFASLYPENPDDFDLLKNSLAKLKLTDPSLSFELESRKTLGRGYLCGFLGSLHAEIVTERLQREFSLNLIVSAPQVSYKVFDKKGREFLIKSAADWLDPSDIESIREPWARLEIITPSVYLGKTLEVLSRLKGSHIEKKYLSPDKILLIFETPFREIISDFYDQLKRASQGYASLNYQILEYRSGDLIKLEILIAGRKEESFSKIVPKKDAYQEGRRTVKKLKEVIPSQQFSVSLQAVIGGRIIARETIRSRRKDVTAPLYGGDYTRKKKLLERQKERQEGAKRKRGIENSPESFFRNA